MRGEYANKTDPNCSWCHDRRCEQLYDDKYWPCEHAQCTCPERPEIRNIYFGWQVRWWTGVIKHGKKNRPTYTLRHLACGTDRTPRCFYKVKQKGLHCWTCNPKKQPKDNQINPEK